MRKLLAGLAPALLFAATAALSQPAPSPAPKPPLVKARLDSGMIVGDVENGVDVFRGVPFAKPPIGALRWRPPQRPDPWPGERAALAFEPPCPQPVNLDGKTANGGGIAGATSEDCLYLQVFAPPGATKAPVLVWLYGGASFLGAGSLGSYDGSADARQGVVVVAINYRLGSLGIFAHPSLTKEAAPTAPLGNYALMDAMEALRWVKRNATAFGGDPDNVTLAGQSAGAIMTLDMMGVPSAKGLFQKAIIESGSFLLPAISLADAEAGGVKGATALGLAGADASADELRAVSAQTFVVNPATQRGAFAGAILDGRLRSVSTGDALKAGTAARVPVLLGQNGGEPFFQNARMIAGLVAKNGEPAFLYHFEYVPEWRKADWPRGAVHSAEIMYAFNSLDTSSWGGAKVTPADRAVADRVNSCWIAFIKAPANARALTCADGFTWPAYSPDTDEVAAIGEAFTLRKGADTPDGPPRPPLSQVAHPPSGVR